jgi:hypothetical protein
MSQEVLMGELEVKPIAKSVESKVAYASFLVFFTSWVATSAMKI